jgi:epoxyqueuosine reductase
MIPSLNELKTFALSIGFDDLGVTTPEIPEEDIASYRKWIREDHQGALHYMENTLRIDPKTYFPEAKTALIFVSSYKKPRAPFKEGAGVIASYARGKDYHNIHRKRLKKIIAWLEEKAGQKGIAKGFSDSSPVLEKALAVKAGLGWFGKNTLLIHRKFGTFTLLAGILTKLEYPATTLPSREARCGSCTKCLNACPTKALIAPYILDAKKCLSYHLIESKTTVPKEVTNPGYAFGCDICQDVCPHNVRPPLATHEDFKENPLFSPYLTLNDLEIIEKKPETLFGTPLNRRGVSGLKANLESL